MSARVRLRIRVGVRVRIKIRPRAGDSLTTVAMERIGDRVRG